MVVDNRADCTGGDHSIRDLPSIALNYTPPPSPHRQLAQPLTPNSDLELTPLPTPLVTRNTGVTLPPLTVHTSLNTQSTRVTPPPLTVHTPLNTQSTRVTPPPLTVHTPLNTQSTRVTPPPLTVHATNIFAGNSGDDSDMDSNEGVEAGVDRVNMTNGESKRVNDETHESEKQGVNQNGGNYGDSEPIPGLMNISNRIDDLARLVETMSARFVLVENQMKLVKSNDQFPTQAHTHHLDPHPSQVSDSQPHISHPSQPWDPHITLPSQQPHISHPSQPLDPHVTHPSQQPHISHPSRPAYTGSVLLNEIVHNELDKSVVTPHLHQPMDHMNHHERLSTPHSTLRGPSSLTIHHSPATPVSLSNTHTHTNGSAILLLNNL